MKGHEACASTGVNLAVPYLASVEPSVNEFKKWPEIERKIPNAASIVLRDLGHRRPLCNDEDAKAGFAMTDDVQ